MITGQSSPGASGSVPVASPNCTSCANTVAVPGFKALALKPPKWLSSWEAGALLFVSFVDVYGELTGVRLRLRVLVRPENEKLA